MRNRTAGVLAAGSGTTLTATQLVVVDTASQESNGQNGYGLVVQQGARPT